jgi:CheY-like chemotaxis protein
MGMVALDPSPAIALLVEDEFLLRMQMAEQLRLAGWTVLEASTGERALSFLKEQQPIDILITDVRLAGKLNGLEVAEAFRCTYPDMPVIYASGNVIENCRLVPRSVFVSKPFDEAELLETCDRLAGRPSRD